MEVFIGGGIALAIVGFIGMYLYSIWEYMDPLWPLAILYSFVAGFITPSACFSKKAQDWLDEWLMKFDDILPEKDNQGRLPKAIRYVLLGITIIGACIGCIPATLGIFSCMPAIFGF